MPLKLKIKTLDSRDHDFVVDYNITVREFKEHIVERIGIAADLQRLIYCGRVLNDEKRLRDYHVNNKVVHLVERAPPRNPNVDDISERSVPLPAPIRHRRNAVHREVTPRHLRPLMSAIDGMLIGSIDIPVVVPLSNNNATDANARSVNPTSHLCMNRITVARHMLECADNIVTYLDNPEAGLQNNDMDILSRQTVESTVLELGISAVSHDEMHQHEMQDFVQAFTGAVSEAFRQNGMDMMQPTVVPNNAAAAPQPQRMPNMQSGQESQSNRGNVPPATAATDAAAATTAAAATPSSSTANPAQAAPTGPRTRSAAAATATGDGAATATAPQRPQTTCPYVLAEVVTEMRRVQARMDPYLRQYYDILANHPSFADAGARETSQRVFDRMSEALHYMSHAQHAISDLMLDLAQPPPRHLSCRPILIDETAYQSAISLPHVHQISVQPDGGLGVPAGFEGLQNPQNIIIELTSRLANHAQQMPQQQQQQQQPPVPQQPTQQSQEQRQQPPQPTADDPTTSLASVIAAATAAASVAVANHVSSAASAAFAGGPPSTFQPAQLNMAVDNANVVQLIQNIVNSVAMYSDYHLDVDVNLTSDPNAPDGGEGGNRSGDEMADVDVHTEDNQAAAANPAVPVAAAPAAAAAAAATAATTAATPARPSMARASAPRQPRVTTATHPTTATQTRSTPRQHVHMTSLPPHLLPRRGVAAPAASFDRFLPCSSHHVRENREQPRAHQHVPGGMPHIHHFHEYSVHPTFHISQQAGGAPPATRDAATASQPAAQPAAQPPAQPAAQPAARPADPRLPLYNVVIAHGLPPDTFVVPQDASAATIASAALRAHRLTNPDGLPADSPLRMPINLFGIQLTVVQLMTMCFSDPLPANWHTIREPLRAVVQRWFSLDATSRTISDAQMSAAMTAVTEFLRGTPITLDTTSQYHPMNSVLQLVRRSLPAVVQLVLEDDSDQFGERLLREMATFWRRAVGVCVLTLGVRPAKAFLTRCMQLLMELENDISEVSVGMFLRIGSNVINEQCDAQTSTERELFEFLTIRQRDSTELMETDDVNVDARPIRDATASLDPITVVRRRIESVLGTGRVDSAPPTAAQQPAVDEDQIPSVLAGSEEWHAGLPTAWLPTIARDIGRQRRKVSIAPFSDAYLSGMSTARRKLIVGMKPAGPDPRQMLTDGIRAVVQSRPSRPLPSTSSSGASGSSGSSGSSGNGWYGGGAVPTANTIIVALEKHKNIHAMDGTLEQAMRTMAEERSRMDDDYSDERYPNLAKWIGEKK